MNIFQSVPVTKTTADSLEEINPFIEDFSNPAKPVAAAGSAKRPEDLAISY
jgi:hypothetical protein